MTGIMSAFTVFVDHWMVDENKAKKREYYRQMRGRILSTVMSKMWVSKFFEIMEQMAIQPTQRLWYRLRDLGMGLVMTHSSTGSCHRCGVGVFRFERRNNDMLLVCQEEHCREVVYFFEELF